MVTFFYTYLVSKKTEKTDTSIELDISIVVEIGIAFKIYRGFIKLHIKLLTVQN